MKVNQGLLNWLNAVNHDDKNYGQTEKGLLLAPIDSVQQNNHETEILIHEINEPVHYGNQEQEYTFELEHQHEVELELEHEPDHETEIESEHKPEPEIKSESESEAKPEHKFELEHEQTEQESESEHEIEFEAESEYEYKLESESEKTEREFELELEQAKRESESEHDSEQEQPQHEQLQHNESQNESQEINTLIGIPDDIVRNSAIKEAEAITQELQTLKDEVASIRETTHGLDLNKAWHEANAGFELSMKEPPPQIWASQNESESESEDEENENDSEDYEHIILQQNSSVTIHGTNFTQRLQRTLQGRKNKAAELRRKNTEKHKHSHSYILHAFMICSVMLLAIGLAWLSLRYLQTKTPDSFNQRASELYEQGKYDEAMNLYQEAYNRYPNDIRFLEGIARSAEKAGHSQTAAIAWDEYRNSHHENQSRDIEPQKAPEPLKININTNTGGGKKESERESNTESKITREPARVFTFDDYLNEANRLYNIRMYTRALVNFLHALEQRNDDIRPYIGLVESYRAKGIDFEAKRILDEAERRFGKNPTIEILKKLLKESK